MTRSAMKISEDLHDHLLSQVLDMYEEKSLLRNSNLEMNDFLEDFSESSVVTKVPAGPKIDPPSFDNDIITDIKLSQPINIIDSKPTRFAPPLNGKENLAFATCNKYKNCTFNITYSK